MTATYSTGEEGKSPGDWFSDIILRVVGGIKEQRENRADRETRFRRVAEKYESLIMRLCFQYATDRMPVEDLCQDCLINIWRGLESFRGESELSTWIYRIVINTCIASYRSASRRPKTEPLSALLTEPEYNADSDAGRIATLHAVLGRISLVDRGIIMMWLDGRSYAEIAEVTGITPGNVGVRIHRIKERMKEIAGQIQ